MLNSVVGFAKNNSVAIMKVAGLGLTFTGTVITAIAGSKEQKIEIAKAVAKATEKLAK